MNETCGNLHGCQNAASWEVAYEPHKCFGPIPIVQILCDECTEKTKAMDGWYCRSWCNTPINIASVRSRKPPTVEE